MSSSEEWLLHLLGTLEGAVIIVGPGREILHVTPDAERLLEVREAHLLGREVQSLLPPERRGEMRNFEDVLAGGAGRRVRSVVRRSGGRRLDVSVALEPCHDAVGNVVGLRARYEPAPSSVQWLRSSLPPHAARLSSPPRAPERPASATSGVYARIEALEARLGWL